jgi:hypothetical protein
MYCCEAWLFADATAGNIVRLGLVPHLAWSVVLENEGHTVDKS